MFSWVVTALLLLANLMTGHKNRHGWLVGVVADISFAVWGALTRQYGFVFGSAVFAGVRLRNYFAWRRQDLSGESLTREPEEVSCAA